MDRSSGSESSEFMDERLSAAIDNELTAQECGEVIDELADSPKLQNLWERQHNVNALLRGEQLASTNAVAWDQIHAELTAQQPARKSLAAIIDFSTFRHRYLVKTIGGAALAASVLLGASMFVVMQQTGSSVQMPPLANETTGHDHPIPPLVAPMPVQSLPPVEQNAPVLSTPQPEVFLVSDQESRQTQKPTQPPRNRGAIPATQSNRDLVRLVSDKPQR